MRKLLACIQKEILLLRRDTGGLIVLFLMPLLLIITVTLIQDSTFKAATQTTIPVLLVNNDGGDVATVIKDNLKKSKAFTVITSSENKPITEAFARQQVFNGSYQLAIILPKGLSSALKNKVQGNVNKILEGFGAGGGTQALPSVKTSVKEVRLYFDPASQAAFRDAVKSSIDKMISQIETRSVYDAFKKQLGDEAIAGFNQDNFITFKEIMPKVGDKEQLPNSTQHNVPAWTLFAIFFIVVPLSVNIVKEKNQGTQVRLLSAPVSYLTVLSGKTITYLFICLVQFYLMVAVGVYVFPHIGLPPLQVSGYLGLMTLVALFAGLAAIGFGILTGTIAKTQEQAAPFGSTAVVILAATGGVWVPVFVMPQIMQYVAKASPMNWGLQAFYNILLRGGGFTAIVPYLALLLLFFVLMILLSVIYDKKKRTV